MELINNFWGPTMHRYKLGCNKISWLNMMQMQTLIPILLRTLMTGKVKLRVQLEWWNRILSWGPNMAPHTVQDLRTYIIKRAVKSMWKTLIKAFFTPRKISIPTCCQTRCCNKRQKSTQLGPFPDQQPEIIYSWLNRPTGKLIAKERKPKATVWVKW